MKQVVTQAIVLSRTDYGEADRIVTLLTPDHGKLSLLAKGVRRVKSKLAGGIELFSISSITFARGRGEVGTLMSSRLEKHYAHIVEDLDRTMLGYELIKELHKITEDEPEPEYFVLLEQTFKALNDATLPTNLIRFWFLAQLLRLGGHTPNLQTDNTGQKLTIGKMFIFDFDQMCFNEAGQGKYTAGHIKFLRLGFAAHSPRILAQVEGSAKLFADTSALVAAMAKTHFRL